MVGIAFDTGPDTAVLASRLDRVRALAQASGIDALLITPGADLRYLTGYDAKPLERLTCLVLPMAGEPVLVVPRLELLAAESSPVGSSKMEILTWGELDDPFALVAEHLPPTARIGVDNRMWAEKVLAFRDALPGAILDLAGPVLERLRMVKDPAEVSSLLAAGAAIDAVHEQVPALLIAGRSEREVGARIHDLILDAGHVQVDFVIVASGPNAASPHHDVSDRILEPGDCVVVDIGGMMPDGYRSDCTRTYHLGAPDSDFAQRYAHLQAAQRASVEHVRAGVTCESIDAAGRQRLASAGLADLFIHRTGHGIGLESHEAPYIVEGNDLVVEPGMAFSIEPGFYDEGRHGARIEDIVVATSDGCLVANNTTHDLIVV